MALKNILNLTKILAINDRYNVIISFFLVVASSVFVEVFSKLALIDAMPPPTSLSGYCHFDCHWYLSILEDGYHFEPKGHAKGDAANWAFFPAFPLAAKLVAFVTTGNGKFSILITSKLFLLIAIMAFMMLVEEEFGSKEKCISGFVLAFNPYIIYAHSGYTETLYFFATTLSFLFLRRKNWFLAGVAGALLSATRLVGVLFVFSYLSKFKELFRENKSRDWPKYVLGLFVCPLGLALYMFYLYFHVGDALAFKHIQIAWGRSIGNPFSILVGGLMSGGVDRFYALTALGSLVMGAWLAIQRRFDYAIFLIGATLIPLATGLSSMPRYVLWQMPFLFGVSTIVSRYKFTRWPYFIFSGAASGFVIGAWFLGKDFLI